MVLHEMAVNSICRPAMNALEKGEAGDATNVTPASRHGTWIRGAHMSFQDSYTIHCARRNPVRGRLMLCFYQTQAGVGASAPEVAPLAAPRLGPSSQQTGARSNRSKPL